MIISTALPAKLPVAGYAEKKEAAPTLAILDDFDGDEVGFPHGQAVESVLLSNSDLKDADVQRMQNMPEQARIEDIMRTNKVDFRTAYSATVMRNVAKFYLSTAQNLSTISKELPTVKVVEQSQGESAARLVGDMLSGLEANEGIRQMANQSFGLPADAPLAKLCESLIKEAESVISDNELVGKARQEYLKAARALNEQGITYLVAGGNHGDLAYNLQQMGVETSGSAFRSIFVNDYATVVGANDAQGNPSTLNSPGSGSEVYDLGEDLPWSAGDGFNQKGVNSGTSFAVPIVAGKVVEMIKNNPELSPFDIESRLQGIDSARVSDGGIKITSNGQQLIADGILEPYISEQIGEGFVTDIFGDTAKQLAEARQERTFFGLPGEVDHEFQLVRIAPDPDGVRKLWVDTYFNEGHHVLRASAKDGAWDPKSVVEELHLDRKRQEEIERRAPK